MPLLMVSSNKKGGKTLFFIKGQHHPKSVFNSAQKVGPALNKKNGFHEAFYSGFPLPNGKQQKPKGAVREVRFGHFGFP